jgi:hypothetical protein
MITIMRNIEKKKEMRRDVKRKWREVEKKKVRKK